MSALVAKGNTIATGRLKAYDFQFNCCHVITLGMGLAIQISIVVSTCTKHYVLSQKHSGYLMIKDPINLLRKVHRISQTYLLILCLSETRNIF